MTHTGNVYDDLDFDLLTSKYITFRGFIVEHLDVKFGDRGCIGF